MSSPLAGLGAALRDPLYRWEVRRYWTARRYVWIVVVLVLFSVLGAGCTAGSVWWLARVGQPSAAGAGLPELFILLGFYVVDLIRLPLGVTAALAGATTLADERTSGQLEQFVLTPVDPWRFALARLAGRLRGFLFFWLTAGGLLAVTSLAYVLRGLPDLPGESGGETPWRMIGSGLAWCDLGLVLALNVVVGMYYSARARSAVRAVIWTLLMCCVVLPIVLYAPAIALHILAMVGALAGSVVTLPREYGPLLQLVGMALHAGLALLFLRIWLGRARRGAERVFLEPEGSA